MYPLTSNILFIHLIHPISPSPRLPHRAVIGPGEYRTLRCAFKGRACGRCRGRRVGGPGRGAGGVCGCRSRCAELRLELIPSGGETREREEPAGHHRTGQREGEGRRGPPPPPIGTPHRDHTGTLLPGLRTPAGGEVIENHLCAPERAERGPAPAGRGRCAQSRYIISHLRRGGWDRCCLT